MNAAAKPPAWLKEARTKTGALSAKAYKAIGWYAIEHGLKHKAASAFPQFYFVDRDGKEVSRHIETILNDYAKFREANYGRKKASA